MTDARISVIVLGYGDEPWLVQCLDSILADPSVECVLVDNGIATEVRAAIAPNERLKVVTPTQNLGYAGGCNEGAAHASGEILVFINSGDMFASNETLALVDQDQKMRGWSWAYGAMNVVDSERNVIDVNNWRNFSTWQLRMGLHSIGHQSAFFTRDLVAKVGLYRSEVGVQSDQDFMLRAADLAEPAYIDEVLASLETGGVSSGLPPDAFVRKAQMIRQLDDRLVWGSNLADGLITSALAATKRIRHRVWLLRGGGTS